MEASKSQHIKSMQNIEHDQNVYQEDTNINLSQGNYIESPQNTGNPISMSGYYTIPHEGDRSMDANNIPYIIPDATESRIPIDPTTMQATAALNQSLMFQNHGLPTDYPVILNINYIIPFFYYINIYYFTIAICFIKKRKIAYMPIYLLIES